MTFSTPFKIIVACFAVVALVATAMSGSSASAGLKGSRKLQQFVGAPPSVVINSIFANSNAIIASINPAAVAPPPPPGRAAIAINTVNVQAANIFADFNP
jgi:hypothetical protein